MTQVTIAGKTKETGERNRGSCASCGRKDRALMAPERGVCWKGYAGAMYCMGCNPRFIDGGPSSAFLRRAPYEIQRRSGWGSIAP